MKYFIVTDIHSYYDEMITELNKKGFDPNNEEHVFVSLGDLFDRGPKPVECLDYVLSLNPQRRILIRGNHEDCMDDAMSRMSFITHDYHNGTVDTAQRLTDSGNPNKAVFNMYSHDKYHRYKRELRNYYETKNAIFVHGWIPCHIDSKPTLITYGDNELQSLIQYTSIEDWRHVHNDEWGYSRWINGMEAWAQGVRADKTVYCGHWHTSWGHARLRHDCFEFAMNNDRCVRPIFDPFIDDGIVALDACTSYSGKVNCYVIEDEPLEEQEF